MIPRTTPPPRPDLLSRWGLRNRTSPTASQEGQSTDTTELAALSSVVRFYSRLARLTELQAQATAPSPLRTSPVSLAAKSRVALPSEEDVIAALAGGDGLRVVFQPQFDLRTREIVGAEALIRWRHPHLGEVPPSTLIPMVQRLGLDMLLFGFVKKRTIEMLRHLHDAGAAVPISINASAKTACTPGLADLLSSRMKRADLPARLLKVELTEDVKATDSAHLASSLANIQATGIRVSLDDFGSGWSTPSLLSFMLFDEVKIEASYVQTMDMSTASRGFIKEILGFSKEFNFDVIAEGVQSESTAVRLAEMGCLFAQGFALARPLEAEIFSKKIIDHRKHFSVKSP